MSRDTLIVARGLRSQGNKYAMEPGSLSKALNVVMRDPGVLSSIPAVRLYRLNAFSNGDTIRRLWPSTASVLAIADNAGTWAARWVTGVSSTAITMPTGQTLSFATGKAQATLSRGRTYLTASNGPMAIDGEADTVARMAGLPPPSRLASSSNSSTNAQAMADSTQAHWRAHFERTVTIGSESIVMSGAVSAAVLSSNETGATIDKNLIVQWTSQHPIEAGDLIRLYRTKTVNLSTDPGDEYRLAATHTITPTNISNGFAIIRDTSADDARGAQLYTNPLQEGFDSNNWVPPLADDIATFKGYTFYASRRLQNQIALKVPGGWGLLTTDAQRTYGVGTRQVTGDTHSNATIDNISATHMLGLVVGQQIAGTGIPANATIATIAGPSSITIAPVATATNAGVSLTVTDRFDVDGTVVQNASPDSLASQLFALQYLAYPDTPTNSADLNASVVLTRYYGGQAQMSIRATNGANYAPPLPEIGATAYAVPWDEKPNRYHWSKEQQPDAVPILDYAFAGSGTLYRMAPTQDSMLMFCSDGLYRLSGDGGEWRTDPVNPTLILAARNAVDVLDETVWAYTNDGLVAVDGAGTVRYVSRGRIGDPSTLPGASYADTWDTYLSCDELHHEVWLTFRSGSTSLSYVYNTMNDAFTTAVDPDGGWSATAYSRALRSLTIGLVSTNPDVAYFEDDTSLIRIGGADVRFQPIEVDDAFTLKQFQAIDWVFQGVTFSSLTLVPSFDGTNYTGASIAVSTIESRKAVGVPRNAPAVAARIVPGFTLSSGGAANNWSFRGLSVQWEPSSEESHR